MQKVLGIGATGKTEVLPIDASTGASDAGKIIATDSAGLIAESLMPAGIGADIKVCPASENLSDGDMVNLFDDAGTMKVRKADASGGHAKAADGFVKAAVSSGQDASVYLDKGINSGLSGLTPGAKYYLSATAGGVTTTAPTTTGHIWQPIGKALSATELSVDIGEPILRA